MCSRHFFKKSGIRLGLLLSSTFLKLRIYTCRSGKTLFNSDWSTPGKEVLATAWNTLEIMYEKRLLILAHQAYYHILLCPVNCLFEKYASSYDLGRKMALKLTRPEHDFLTISVLYKSIIWWNALENQMSSRH